MHQKTRIAATVVGVASALVASQSMAAVAAATSAMTEVKADGEAIITLGFAVVAALGALWLGIKLVKRLISKVG